MDIIKEQVILFFLNVTFIYLFIFTYFAVLGIKPRASHVLGKRSITS
jgi:hypothetical protein